MGGVQRRRASSAKNKSFHKGLKPKRYGRDHDQINSDLKNPEKFKKM